MGCQPVESTSPFKVLVSDVNLHHYNEALCLLTQTLAALRRRLARVDAAAARGKAVQVEHIRLTPG